jgi:hypothetical protein
LHPASPNDCLSMLLVITGVFYRVKGLGSISRACSWLLKALFRKE